MLEATQRYAAWMVNDLAPKEGVEGLAICGYDGESEWIASAMTTPNPPAFHKPVTVGADFACEGALHQRNNLFALESELLAAIDGHRFTMFVGGSPQQNHQIVSYAMDRMRLHYQLSLMARFLPTLLIRSLDNKVRWMVALASQMGVEGYAICGCDSYGGTRQKETIARVLTTLNPPRLLEPTAVGVRVECLRQQQRDPEGNRGVFAQLFSGHKYGLFVGGTDEQNEYIRMMVLERMMAP